MSLNRELRILTRALLIAFAVVAAASAYWASIERDRLLAREDNPRLLEARASIRRGAIYDRDLDLLVHTEEQSEVDEGTQRRLVRHYLSPAFYGALGYFSLTYGTGGFENQYDRILSGADRPRSLDQIFFAAPVEGSDIQITLDSQVQITLRDAFENHQGAAVVMSVPSGDILAILSHPTYDPNALDENWAVLLEDSGNPFFNRALQGRYQPGGMTQTPLLALFEISGIALISPFPQASAPVTLENILMTCAVTPPRAALTLVEAYRFGCPAPFLQLGAALQPSLVARALQQLNQATQPSAEPANFENVDNLRNSLLGQGEQIVSPLDIALLAASILNEGNAPQPRSLLATRYPDAGEWAPSTDSSASVPVMTAAAAARLQEIMALTDTEFAGNFQTTDALVGAHSALAYSGEGALVWFMGFARMPTGQGIAVAVVIEDTRDPADARDIGIRALQAAIAASSPSATLP